jgi:transcriptional regulator with XRE-family HTH domain
MTNYGVATMGAPKAESSLINLSQVLDQVGLSQTRLAEVAEVDRTTISRIATYSAVKTSTILKVFESLKETLDGKFNVEMEETDKPSAYRISAERVKGLDHLGSSRFQNAFNELIITFSELVERDRESALLLIQSFAKSATVGFSKDYKRQENNLFKGDDKVISLMEKSGN